MRQSMAQTISDSEKIRLDLIATELDLGRTFAQIALQATDDMHKRQRNTLNARAAYDAVSRLIAKALMTEDESRQVQAKHAELESQLIDLGEVFP